MTARGYFITGTDTGVGKTAVTACLAGLFKKHGWDTGVMKPVETGIDPDSTTGEGSDAEFLLRTADAGDSLEEVSPFRLRTPASPYLASRLEDRPIHPEAIPRAFHLLVRRHEWMLVEGVGGFLVPLTRDYTVADLVRDMALPLIIVSRPTLGTLNHTLLTVEAARARGIEIRGIVFNHQEAREPTLVEKHNPEILRELSGVPVLGELPFIDPLTPEAFTPQRLTQIEPVIGWNRLVPAKKP